MNILRQRLLQECPPLHAALENSWTIANDKWLASIPPSEGSYNSGPHFRNIEGHLERLLVPWSVREKKEEWAVKLSTLELYLLLASVLFHDCGRVVSDENHSGHSKDLLHEHYASLGIVSRDLADSLGRIALYHDPIQKLSKEEQDDRTREIKKENHDLTANAEKKLLRIKSEKRKKRSDFLAAREALSDITIEPYGRARELHVATLLALADHLDASADRTEPYFVRPDDVINFKGAFRRMVVGSAYDPDTKCIKTCLANPWAITKKENNAAKKKKGGVTARKTTSINDELKAFDISLFDEDGLIKIIDDKNPAHQWKWALNEIKKTIASAKIKDQENSPIKDLYDELEIMPRKPRRALFQETLKGHCILTKKNPKLPACLPQDYIFAIVLKDLKANREFLNPTVKDDLKDIGLPIEDWLLEYKGKTYDNLGQIVEVPVFRINDFKRLVAENMEELSKYAFAHNAFTYEVLADSLRTDEVDLVKLAVQQLARDKCQYIENGKMKWVFGDSCKRGSRELRAYPKTWELRTVLPPKVEPVNPQTKA